MYYVIGADGNKYGPADVSTLKQWIADNRLNAQTILEDMASGQRILAGQVPGLFETSAQPGGAPTSGQPYVYPRYSDPAQVNEGRTYLIASWVCTALGFLICCTFVGPIASGLGVMFAYLAESRGHTGAKAAKVVGIIVVIISVIVVVLLYVYKDSLRDWALEQRRLQNSG